jgi:hypothetical protein
MFGVTHPASLPSRSLGEGWCANSEAAFRLPHSGVRWAFRCPSRASHLLFTGFVESADSVAVVSPVKDITFACNHCSSPLVVDAAAAGMTLPCQRCGKPTLVPAVLATDTTHSSLNETNSRVTELRRQLKENESQRTEVTGYINQLSIQLHRWQLRLQTLEERRKQLENDLQGAR